MKVQNSAKPSSILGGEMTRYNTGASHLSMIPAAGQPALSFSMVSFSPTPFNHFYEHLLESLFLASPNRMNWEVRL